MATATSWMLTLRFYVGGSGKNAGEIAQIGLKGRAGGAERPASGTLPNFDVLEGAEEESWGSYDIQWSNWTPATGPGTLGVTQDCMKDMVTAANTYLTTITSHINNATYFDEARITLIDRFGKAIGASSNKFIRKSPFQMTGAGAMPPQVSLVVSTRSEKHGRRGHGRWYVPFPAVGGLAADGTVVSSTRTAHVNAAADFVRSIRDINTNISATTDVTPAVISTERQDYADITSVRVGDFWDTQRRRRNANPETYATTML